ncbi:DNA-binding transcriptional regulator YhcF, GntR family [Algoriphagus ornithinivorans]|uniref:DNA-binding transcriptional regulator YhcF, GntR family n=1 Tax=Algoriphagus ornithinivorans TaxID=226506 RepID=A0A1I5IUB2_9BACT|nr:GntR family transcriptional regulator [Algoriphagus ornithinivorans]SFO64097.1 DNA-binding transcriptional regulator YhcF, GntR family [Algoriphagus ornithinivorans]
MDFSEHKNIFLQIRDWLVDQILIGKLQPGEKIPSVRELAADIEVNRNTVMRSYSLMEEEGIIENKRGIGFFIASDATTQLQRIQKREFFEQELPGIIHKVEVLKLNSQDLAQLLQVIQSNDHENKQ